MNRNDVLEEAAKICEDKASMFAMSSFEAREKASPLYDPENADSLASKSHGCLQVAYAIRAAKTKDASDE